MVKGLEAFKRYFKEYADQYILIGGTACDLLMDDSGLDFRATKDFDMVLIIEALTDSFIAAFWQFIKDGGYTILQTNIGKPQFYRFSSPKLQEYPAMIELFSASPDMILKNSSSHLTPIHISDEISSLSAILLDKSYYAFLLSGIIFIDELPVLNTTHIIPFKAKAWLDLKQRKENGQAIDSRHISKHKNDIFRLFSLLTADTRIPLPSSVLNDMKEFITHMHDESIDLKALAIRGQRKEEMLEVLKQIYIPT